MYFDLGREGHDVRAFVADVDSDRRWLAWSPPCPTGDSRAGLGAGRRPRRFRASSRPRRTARCRTSYALMGSRSSAAARCGDRLENDRAFGQQVMRGGGHAGGPHPRASTSFDAAIAFVRARPRRYVYKPSGSGFASGRTFVGADATTAPTCSPCSSCSGGAGPPTTPVRLVLMERLEGVEVGVGAYFDGDTLPAAGLPRLGAQAVLPRRPGRAHRRDGDAGHLPRRRTPVRGDAGTHAGAAARRWLPRLHQRQHHRRRARASIRWSSPAASATRASRSCKPLQRGGWDELFRLDDRRRPERPTSFPTPRRIRRGRVLTVPPFPYAAGYERLSKGLPVLFRGDLTDADRAHLHFGEVALSKARPAGHQRAVGYIMVVTGVGATARGGPRRRLRPRAQGLPAQRALPARHRRALHRQRTRPAFGHLAGSKAARAPARQNAQATGATDRFRNSAPPPAAA